LKQKVLDLHSENNAMKTVTEKCQIETNELREKSSKESAEMRSEIEKLTKELDEKTALAASQKEELVSLSFSLSLSDHSLYLL
jgi:hypothetical protein